MTDERQDDARKERDDERGEDRAKQDRTARLLNTVAILQQCGDAGATPNDIAARNGVSRRTAYRDLKAIERELHLSVWAKDGRWGVNDENWLPPLRLTLPEAMAVFLSARLMTRFMDRHDPHLASAFTKLERALPPALAYAVERTVQEMSARPLDAASARALEDLTHAWAARREVQFDYAPGLYGVVERPRERRHVRPYLLEPSLATRALYLIGHDVDRNAMRTFKVERISSLAVLPQGFDAPEADVVERLRAAWDIIADQPPTEVALRFAPAVAARVMEATWHPTQELDELEDGSLEWRAVVSGTVEIKLWILSWGSDVEVIGPAALRDEVAATLRRAADQYVR
jgi:predicted DNA-binding transcriptional regulator YafY